jgi:hypothetical protein
MPHTATLSAIFFVWCGLLLTIRIVYVRLGRAIGTMGMERWDKVQFRDGTPDPLEGFRWYFRLRSFAKANSSISSDVRKLCRRMLWLMRSAEYLSFLLLVLIVLNATGWPLHHFD